MSARGGDEPCRGGAEHELEHLPSLAAHLQPSTVFVHCKHGAPLEAAAEVRDARLVSDAGNGS
jgi:hypothetical protein